jgi:hypothetical protein
MSSGFFGQERGEASVQGPTPSARAVVWMPIGTQAPPPLIESLKRKDVGFVMVHSELLAMAHACSMHRSGSGIMILCEPASLPKVAHTVALARRYATRTLVYAYKSGAPASQQLAPVSDQDLVDWAAASPSGGTKPPVIGSREVPAVSKVQPTLQLDPHAGFMGGAYNAGLRLTQPLEADEAPSGAGMGSGPIVRDDAPPSDVLSADELAMLLGREPREKRP